MPTLSPSELRSRGRYDAMGVAALNESDFPVEMSGHRNAADAGAGRNPVPLDSDDPATFYRMICRFNTLSAPAVPLTNVVFVVDTRAGGDYPGTEPVALIASRPVPFAPHIGANGAVCHGHFAWVPWRTELPEYLAQLCRLLNYDEPPPNASFTAMNPAAVRHWAALGHRPLDPGLGSPVINLNNRAARRPLRRAGGDDAGSARRARPMRRVSP